MILRAALLLVLSALPMNRGSGSPPGAGSGPAPDEVELRVLDPDGQPLPELDCVTLLPSRLQAESLGPIERAAPWLAIRRLGDVVRTDAEGVLRLQSAGGADPRVVYAETPEARGYTMLAPEGGTQELRLLARWSVEVRVRDGLGEPVGRVPLCVRWLRPGMPNAAHQVGSWATCDEDGRAVLDGLELAAMSAGDATPHLGPGFPLAREILRPIPSGPGRVELDLTLPQTGSLELVLPGRGEAQASVLLERVREENEDDRLALPPPWPEIDFVDGVARIEHVGLGLRLRARVAGPDLRSNEALEFDGPQRAGQTLRVEVPVEDRGRITGRLLDRDGSPLATQSLGVMVWRIHDSGRGGSGSPIRTDAQGVFVHQYDPHPDETATRRFLSVSRRTPFGAEQILAVVPLDELLAQGGPIDLGDVRVGQGPLVAAGRVVDAQGQPIADARIQLLSPREGSTSLGRWRRSPECHSDEDGRFELLGIDVDESPGHALSVQAEGWSLPQDLAITPGSRDLRVVMAPAGSLSHPNYDHGRTGPKPIQWVLVGPGPNAKTPAASRRLLRDLRGPRHRYTSLAPGEYHLSFREQGLELMRIEGIQVEAGVETRDPRLEELRREDVVRELCLRVSDAEGRPLEATAVKVWLSARDGSRLARGRLVPAERGSSPLLYRLYARPQGSVEVMVEARAHRPQTVEMDSDLDLRLPPALPLSLKLRGPVPALASGVRMGAMLVPEGQRLAPRPLSWRVQADDVDELPLFDTPRGLDLFAVQAGAHELYLGVGGRTRRAAWTEGHGELLSLGPIPVSIEEVDGVQELEIVLTEEMRELAEQKSIEIASRLKATADR